MLFMRKTTALPSAAEALPGRANPIPTASSHFVNGRQLQPPYPAGLEQAVFGLGCFWGAERKFWSSAKASTRQRSAMPAGIPKIPLTRRFVRDAPVIPKRCWWCSIPGRSRTSNC